LLWINARASPAVPSHCSLISVSVTYVVMIR
jgi:hypothetical protein